MLESLGIGGAGAVFKAFDTQLDRYVAIKRLLSKQEEEQEDAQSSVLRKEAGSLATLQHPNIVTIYDLGSDDEGMFIVMELLEGDTPADLIEVGTLNLQDFFELASQTLEGALYAHSLSILHRDLKPENIKVKRQPGGRLQVKIVDFGLARLAYGARKQTEDQSGNVLGSIFYMAPEQFLRQPLDSRTDLYSLGCVYYQVLSGLRPFQHETMAGVLDMHLQHQVALLHDVCPHLPERVCDWVMWLFNREPNDRPGNAQIALESLRSLREQGEFSDAPAALPEPAPAKPVTAAVGRATGVLTSRHHTGAAMQPAVPERKKVSIWLYIVSALVLLGAGLFFWMLFSHSGKSPAKAAANQPENMLAPPPADFMTPGAFAHWRAGEKMDAWPDSGGAIKAAKPEDSVATWRSLVPDGGEVALTLLENKQNFRPKYVYETPKLFKIGVGLAHFEDGNAMIQSVDLKKPEAQGYPFGNKSKVKGLTLIMLVRPKITDKPVRIIRLSNQENKGLLDVRAFPNNEFTAGMKAGDKTASAKVGTKSSKVFSIISVVWNGATNKTLLCARSADGVKHGPAEIAAPKGCPVLNEIRIGESTTSGAEAGDFFQGDIGEVMLWPFPMAVEPRTLMEQKLCEFYFTTPGQRY